MQPQAAPQSSRTRPELQTLHLILTKSSYLYIQILCFLSKKNSTPKGKASHQDSRRGQMTRRCSHCSNNGHNSRTCPNRGVSGGGGGSSGVGAGVKLFGVRLTDGSIMKKSASMGNLPHYHSSSSAAASPNPSSPSSDPFRDSLPLPDGYVSDDPEHASCSANRRGERKKGVPWTEEEHRLFLLGLQKLGKGDWRGISRNFVTSRTPTQVASHAQKYFIRQNNATRRKRRSSLFDMVPEGADPSVLPNEQYDLPPQVVDSSMEQLGMSHSLEEEEDDNERLLPSLDLSLKPDIEPMEASPNEPAEETKEFSTLPAIPSVLPPFFPAYIPLPFSLWSSNITPVEEDIKGTDAYHHEILKPIPTLPKEPVNVDELVGMSQLSLADSGSNQAEPSQISLKLIGHTSRQSAFHATTPTKVTKLSNEKSS